jgi:hypothetical protein
MKGILIITLIAMLFPYGVYAQIGDEIASYVDSTEITVQKGRKLLHKELSESNFEKTKEIYDYLTEVTKGGHYAAFYFSEDLYVNMLAGDWESVNRFLLDYEKYRIKRIYPNSQELSPETLRNDLAQ